MIWRIILCWLAGVSVALADLPHAVMSANGLNYAYNLCGNMLVRAGRALVYNPDNRLIAAVASNQVTTFGYAGDGTRLWKQGPGTNTLQVWIDGNYEERDGKTLYHVYAGSRIVYTFDSGSSIFQYYIPDHLHPTEFLTGQTGSVSQHYEYGAWGQSRYASSTSAFPASHRYTSQVLDDETGLYYFGARYYDPQIGRFIQPDTIIPNLFDPQSLDRYAYARDNPFVYVDPDGHAPWYYYIPVAGPGIVNMEGGFQRREQADSLGYPTVGAMNAALHLGAPTTGDVPAVQGAANVTEGSANMYLTGVQEIVTAGIGAGVSVVAAGERALARTTTAGAEETGVGVAQRVEANEAKGGTYKLTDAETGAVKRTGQTKDLERREAEHALGKDTKDLDFNIDMKSDDYAVRRGREQIIHDQHPEARVENGGLNKNQPIGPKNPNRQSYLDAAGNAGGGSQ